MSEVFRVSFFLAIPPSLPLVAYASGGVLVRQRRVCEGRIMIVGRKEGDMRKELLVVKETVRNG